MSRPRACASLARRMNGSITPRTGAPDHMKARHGIAVAHGVIAAALGPTDRGKKAKPHRMEPRAFFASSEADIGLRPLSRPIVVIAIEARRTDPVLQCQIITVLDAEPALLWRIDQKQSTERPECLAAEVLLAFLIDDDRPLAGFGDFGGRHQPCQSAADDNDVCIPRHRVSLVCWFRHSESGRAVLRIERGRLTGVNLCPP